jgi:hypothetical protein
MNHKKLSRLVIAAIAVISTVIGTTFLTGAAGAVVIRLDDGNTWTVGKGDVQSLFGWTAQMTDANFAGVIFSYQKQTDTQVTCEYFVSHDEIETIETPSKTITRTVTVKNAATFQDVSTRLMERQLQYEIKKNSNNNVVGAKIWPGASSTTTDFSKACDIDKALANGVIVLDDSIGEYLEPRVYARPDSTIVTETIFATSPTVTTTSKRGSVATTAGTTMTLWSAVSA